MLLSICIPTYNRIQEVTQIIDSLLALSNEEFEVVITDNCSTDGTEAMIQAYSDVRVRYCKNENPLPPFMNMIHSIFNGSGKYALYCNDRDLLHPDGIERLIEVLRQTEVAFLWGPAKTVKSSDSLNVYKQGIQSLLNQACIHHPTGMVYNRSMMKQYLKESDYEQFVPLINTYDFLMLDLMQYGDTAVYDGGYWNARPAAYIKKHASGTAEKRNVDIAKLYFSPEMREKMFYGFVTRILLENKYDLSEEEEIAVLLKLYAEFGSLFCKYKVCMSDENETAHYGIERRFVSTLEILKRYSEFFDRSIEFLKDKGIKQEVINTITKNKVDLRRKIVLGCLKADAVIIYLRLK